MPHVGKLWPRSKLALDFAQSFPLGNLRSQPPYAWRWDFEAGIGTLADLWENATWYSAPSTREGTELEWKFLNPADAGGYFRIRWSLHEFAAIPGTPAHMFAKLRLSYFQGTELAWFEASIGQPGVSGPFPSTPQVTRGTWPNLTSPAQFSGFAGSPGASLYTAAWNDVPYHPYRH